MNRERDIISYKGQARMHTLKRAGKPVREPSGSRKLDKDVQKNVRSIVFSLCDKCPHGVWAFVLNFGAWVLNLNSPRGKKLLINKGSF